MRLGRVSPPPPSAHPTDATASGSSPPAPSDIGAVLEAECHVLESLATAAGETPGGGWPWPNLLGALVGLARSPVVAERGAVPGPNSQGQWPTPVTHDQSTNYAQGGMSLGYAARWPTPNTLDAAPPRDPATVAEWNNARDGRTGRKALANLRQAVVDPYYQEKFPTPRAEDSECAGAHRGVPDTLTSYTRVRPTPQMFCTPTVEDASRSGDAEMARKWARGERVPDTHQRLRTQVLVPSESFPTPTVYDATGHGAPRAEQKEGSRHAVSLHHLAAEWPTPTSADGRGGPGGHRGGGENLRTAVANHADTSWPTPRSKDWKGADLARDENRSGARHSGDDLATAVEKARVEMFPTPTLSDATGGRTTAGGHAFPTSLNAHVRGLRDGMGEDRKTWPTPMAGPVVTQDGGGHGGVKLAEAATEEEAGPDAPRGQLNPDWVEWLMGWPVGWTSTDPLTPEAFEEWAQGMVEAWWWHQEPPSLPRIAVGIKNRVPRLKAIGNGQVSLCAAWAVLALFEMERQVSEASEADGPPEIDFFDLIDGL